MKFVNITDGMQRFRSFLHQHIDNPSSRQVAIFASLLIFAVGVLTSGVIAHELAQQNIRDYAVQLENRANTIGGFAEDTVNGYERLLLAGAAFFMHDDDTMVTRSEWRNFYHHMKVKEQFPTLLGLGYAEYMTTDQIEAYQQRMRAEGHTDFTIQRDAQYKDLGVITYLEPFNEVNQRAFGYDMMSEQKRRAAMLAARDQAQVTISEPVSPVQDQNATSDNEANQYGILMYYPVYSTDNTPTTVEERRATIIGFTYLVVRPADVFNNYISKLPNTNKDIDAIVTDTTNNKSYKLYSVDNSTVPAAEQQSFEADYTVGSRIWNIKVSGYDGSFSRNYGSGAVFALGVLVTTLIVAGVYMLLKSRLDVVEKTYEEEVQRTKDELLALASHQLRTPASGVKQYIGLLTEGILGELTEPQKEVAHKAYEANERQLEIINELLYVSKIDAGQLHLSPQKMDIARLIRRVADNFTEQADRKNITLSLHGVVSQYIEADDRFVSMIIENLISNAIKYSHPSKKVTIKLKVESKEVSVSVSDHGVGIPENEQHRLFGKFNRIDNALSRSEGGSGLGLFLAKRLAEAHGGDIHVSSKAGVGSTFTLTLPRKLTHSSVIDLNRKK